MNVVAGVLISPVLWFGWQILKVTSSPPDITVSPDWNDPETIVISINFGITSIPLVLSKKG